MSYAIRDPYSLPITIPDASAAGPGVMTPAMVATLAAVTVGDFVALSYGPGFSAGPTEAAQTRVDGDTVVFKGSITGPASGVSAGSQVATIPSDQIPSVNRVVHVGILLPQSPPPDLDGPNFFAIPGVGQPFAGNILILNPIPAADSGITIWLDNLSYVL